MDGLPSIVTVTIEPSERDCGVVMRECICGKVILRRKEKGHREREYCSDACRQRACRERNRSKRTIEQIKKRSEELWLEKIEQEFHREIWQDELQLNEQYIKKLEADNQALEVELAFHREVTECERVQNRRLQDLLAEKEAEIARLTFLLEHPSKRKPSHE